MQYLQNNFQTLKLIATQLLLSSFSSNICSVYCKDSEGDVFSYSQRAFQNRYFLFQQYRHDAFSSSFSILLPRGWAKPCDCRAWLPWVWMQRLGLGTLTSWMCLYWAMPNVVSDLILTGFGKRGMIKFISRQRN